MKELEFVYCLGQHYNGLKNGTDYGVQMIGNDGIPIGDEIELEIVLTSS